MNNASKGTEREKFLSHKYFLCSSFSIATSPFKLLPVRVQYLYTGDTNMAATYEIYKKIQLLHVLGTLHYYSGQNPSSLASQVPRIFRHYATKMKKKIYASLDGTV
jgi:hypothetical protein